MWMKNITEIKNIHFNVSIVRLGGGKELVISKTRLKGPFQKG